MRPTLRVVLYLPALGLAYLAAGVAAVVAAAVFFPALVTQGFDPGTPLALILSGAGFAAALSVTYAFRRWVDRAPLAGLGLERAWARDLSVGFALGAGLMGLLALIEAIFGGYVFGLASPRHPLDVLSYLVLALATHCFVAAAEELVARGYLLQTLERGWGTAVALVVSSALFGLAHLGNPHAGLVSTLGITAAGLLLGAAYLATRSLWVAIGLHWSWNYFQGPVFGFPVSGLPGQGLLTAREQGPDWLTGGAFGPEASLLAVAVELVAAGALLYWAARRGRLGGRSPLRPR